MIKYITEKEAIDWVSKQKNIHDIHKIHDIYENIHEIYE